MKANERFVNLVNGRPIDRMPVIEWAPWWDQTVARWHREGLPASCTSVYDIQDYFGLDKCIQTLIEPRSAQTPVPAAHGLGIVSSEEDYLAIRKTLYPDPTLILTKERLKWIRKTSADGDTIHFLTLEGFFWYCRTLLGIEPHLYSFYDCPELLHLMCRDHAEWLKKTIEIAGNEWCFDFMSFEEDMSYNLGPMISEEIFNEFVKPYYLEVMPLLKAAGLPVFIDSDGDITMAVDWYAGVGADGMFPLERQAGVDVSVYVDKHPDMTFLGHYDKMVMHKGEAALRAEFERILPAAQRGKVIISVDHQTPPAVSIEDYRLYVRLLKEYAKKLAKN